MFLREWFRPPRHLLALFVAVIVLPAIALAWLAWRTFQQDKALERQRVQERLETAASSVIAGLDRRLDELARQIPILAASANVSLPDDFLLVTIRDATITLSPPGRALYYPRVPEGRRPRDAGLAAAEALEFRSQDLASARDAFRRLARSGDAAVEAAALLGLARCLRKSGQDPEALAVYDDLARLGTFLVEGVPADLVARHARCALLAHMNAPELTPQAAALQADLQKRRWILDRASYAFYSGEVRAWLPPAAAPPADPLVLALTDAAGDVDRLRHETGVLPGQGRQAAWLHDRPLLVVWANTPREMMALVAGPSWFAQTASLSKTLNVALALVDGQSHVVAGAPQQLAGPVVVRRPADSGLPWTLRIASADPAKELALLSGSRRLALGGLILLGILILTGGYLVERALARELAAVRLQADFVATVSHEFRSPLTSMKHLLEMLEQNAVTSEDRRHRYYEVLSGETERLRQLVENLLNFRRMEAGRAEFRFEPVDAVDLVERVAADFRAQLASSDRLVVSADAHGLRVSADREAMSRALWNLLDNAAKYSPREPPITVEAESSTAGITIRVHDEGGGIPIEEQQRIFDKFVRGASARAGGSKGTGLGLAMV
jgi:signal transduction histidine kinase